MAPGRSTYRLVDSENLTNEPGMSMKTKHNDNKSPSPVALTAGSAVCGSFTTARTGRGSQIGRTALRKWTEQSQYVYENK